MTHRKVPVERVGLYVPGGLAPLVVQRGHERRARPGGRGRRRSRWRRPPQKEFGGLPAPDDPGRLRAARRRRGLRRRRRPGDRHVRLRRRARAAPVDLVTGPGNIYVAAAKRLLRGRGRHRLRGRARPRSRSSPTTPPTRRYVAADLISQAEHDPLAAARAGHRLRARWPTRSRPSSTSRSPRPGTPSGSAPRWPAGSPAIVLVDDLEQGLAVVDAYAAEHLEIQTARRRRGRRPRAQRRRDLRRLLRAGLAGRLLRRLQPRAARRPAAPATPRVCRCGRSSSRCTSSTTPAARWPRSPTTSSTLAEAEDLPGARRGRPVPASARA